jgi:hypothetical protein
MNQNLAATRDAVDSNSRLGDAPIKPNLGESENASEGGDPGVGKPLITSKIGRTEKMPYRSHTEPVATIGLPQKLSS